ncbi:MAG: EF-Tu/IF-2/RF-3 family GTPase [Candidatus Poseidoniaceae archaeon]|jgi:selenocysteine-specific translation elongation factor|nr:EF-Tu/IF-2/RF-3 family GTPase [Candidatus Poseidoniaceae archaeon]
MTVLNIAMVGSDDLAKSIAKATDQRDVHTYVHKENGPNGARILSIIRPAKLPERIRPLFNSLCAARVGLIEVNKIDSNLGEVIVAFASSGITNGIIVINPNSDEWIDEEQVIALFTQAGLSNWTQCANEGTELRSTLYDLMDEIESELMEAQTLPLVVPIDQYFNVKGIGLVAIGYVQSGSIKVHDELHLLPAEGPGTVKSLQVMDDDVPIAVAGDRVGIALRNTKEDHLSGGSIVLHKPIEDKNKGISMPLAMEKHMKSIINLNQSPFQKRKLLVGDVVHASVDLQFVVGRIESVDGELIVEWESPLYSRIENPPKVLIAQLDSKPRIMGSANLIRLE